MKWVFLAALFVFVPMLTALLRSNRNYLVYAAFALGAVPFFIVPNLIVAPISWAAWPGTVKGLEVSLVDGMSLAVLLSTQKPRGSRVPLSLTLAFCLVLLALCVSTMVSYQRMAAIFYIWQLMRSALLFLAVVRICAVVPSAPVAILSGMGVGLTWEAINAFIQYAGGNSRPGGNLGHSNFLGLASNMVTFPALALAIGGRRTLLPAITVAAGFVIAIVGGSRATLGLFAIGSVLTIFLSIRHRRTSKKFAFAGGAALLLLIATPVMFWALGQRSEQDKISSNEERAAMKLAAKMMITDHPLGVGANQYVLVAISGGYSERAGVPWSAGNRSAPVHSVYYLVTAELGYLGLVGLLSLLTSILLIGFRTLGKPWNDESSEMVPGLVASAIAVCTHMAYEWVFMHFVLHYLFAIDVGLMVALYARSRAAALQRRPVAISEQVPLPRELPG